MVTETKIFIGNLSFKATPEELKAWISGIVPESSLTGISIIQRGNRSLGYGFATFTTLEAAQEVVTKLNHTTLLDRQLNVEMVRSPPPPQPSSSTPPNPPSTEKKGTRSKRKKENKQSPQPPPPQNQPPNQNQPSKQNRQPKQPKQPKQNKNENKSPAQISKTALFVSNLPFTITEEEFRNLFADRFIIKSTSLVRKASGRLKGFGFVEFAYAEDARNAILEFDGYELDGRKLVIKPALVTDNWVPEPENQPHFTVKASNLPKELDENQLVQLFRELSISSCYVLRNPETGASLQEGLVEFNSDDDAQKAVRIINGFVPVPGAKPLIGKIVDNPANVVYTSYPPNATNPPNIPNNTHTATSGKRTRPKYRHWRGRILHGRPPPCAYKDFPFPLHAYYLPYEFEEIVYRRSEIMDVQVEHELRNLMLRLNIPPGAMNQQLKMAHYINLFHHLIHTEETRMRVDIRQYDLTEVNMTYKNGLYVIQVPGLAEKRPSVLRGDIVKVKLHGEDEDIVIHDGYAHYVNLDNVHVSFHNDIYQYVAKKYTFDVQFTFNRTPIRLFHRATNVSHALWQKLFFSPKLAPPARLPVSSYFGKVALNQEQSLAVVTILHNKDTPLVLHGPPGTGKTSTLVEAILQIVHRSASSRILVCAPSNSAVDLIASLLVPSLGKATMLRLNSFMRDPKLVDPQSLLDYCYRNSGSFDLPDVYQLAEYNIILATCVSSGYLASMGISTTHFTHIFVDEAGEALEPETLIPLYLSYANTSIVLAGDHLQLGPIVRSSTALEWRYDRSLMEHLLDMFPGKFVCKLVRSYRAHPALMNLYNALFYKGELINCADLREATSLLKWKELPNRDIPLMFIHNESEEARDPDSPSWYNFAEKEIVMEIVKNLLDDRTLGLAAADIGIITPYRKQVQKINQLAHYLGSPYNGCKVGTVENFQGQERKVIIISLVRSRVANLAHDSKFKLGFCDNPKRLNVALSRAKDLLVIIGNGTLFGSNDPNWASLLAHFQAHNLFKGQAPTWHYTPKQQPPTNDHSQTSTHDDINADQGWDNDGK